MSIRARVLTCKILLHMEKNPETAKSLGIKATRKEVLQERSKKIPILLESLTDQ